MTYVLGSRCSDGVVIVDDRKHTIDTIEKTGDSVYDKKILDEFSGVITGFAGIRGSYELFVMNMNDYILKNGNISHNEFLLKSIEITQKLKRNDYEVLFGK
jgi:hypothetical protein